MKKPIHWTILAALALALLPALAAQVPVTKEETITRQQADAILNELRQIRQLLERQMANNAARPKSRRRPSRRSSTSGREHARLQGCPLTMVEFTDYQCPFCQHFHTTVFNDLKKNYVDTGKLRFYSRDLPLDIHSNALRAAEAARCAADQGQFWALRDLMGSNPDKLDMESLAGFAGGLKMDVAAFRSCVQSEKYKNAVQTDTLEALKIGADGTPAFVIGRSTPEGVDGELMVGAMPYPVFEQKLKDLAAAK